MRAESREEIIMNYQGDTSITNTDDRIHQNSRR